jgi:hypothetical protein
MGITFSEKTLNAEGGGLERAAEGLKFSNLGSSRLLNGEGWTAPIFMYAEANVLCWSLVCTLFPRLHRQ